MAYWRLVTPSSVTMTSSPGSTSRSYLARSRSKAQVSEAKTMVSGPSGLGMRPMESGRKPRGSRAAKMRSRVIMTMEKAPSTCESESAMASTSVPARGVGDELDDDLGVGGGLEVGAVALEAGAEVAEVDQVAVVGDGDEALGGVDADGLGVEQRRVAGGGVAGVADGHVAGELGEHFVGEDFRDQAHALDVGEMLAVGGGDAGRFLAAMLEGVEAEIGLARGVGMAVDGDDAAFFAELVEVHVRIAHRGSWRRRGRWQMLIYRSRRRLPGRAAGSCEDLAVESGFQGGGPGGAKFVD